jgi:hypothetical protein
MDVHPTKNVSIGIDPYPYIYSYRVLKDTDGRSQKIHPARTETDWTPISYLGNFSSKQRDLGLSTNGGITVYLYRKVKCEHDEYASCLEWVPDSQTAEVFLVTEEVWCFLFGIRSHCWSICFINIVHGKTHEKQSLLEFLSGMKKSSKHHENHRGIVFKMMTQS